MPPVPHRVDLALRGSAVLDQGVVPYDYTVYSCAMCAESLRFYWTTYEDQRPRYVDLHDLRGRTEPVQFALDRKPDFLCLSR